MSPNLTKAISVAATTVGGALGVYFSNAIANGFPESTEAWRTLLTGAALAALASLIHLYQTPPASGAAS